MGRHLGLVTLFTLLVTVVVAYAADLRGVHPSDAALYSGQTFACKDGSKTNLPLSKVNDDYCDCADGSDEPGTSACENGRFFCANRGHIGLSLFSSRVNDGICDCCDGSDEYSGQVKCQDTCYALGEDTRNAKRQEIEAFKKGLEIRREYEAEAKTVREEKQKRIEELKASIAQKEQNEKDLQAQVDGLEAKAKAAEELLAQYKPKEGQENQENITDDEDEDEDDEGDDEGDDGDEDEDYVDDADGGSDDGEEPSNGQQTEEPKVLLERTDDVKEALEQAEKDVAEYKASKAKERKEGGGVEADEGVLASLWRFLGFASSSSSPASTTSWPLSGEVKMSDLKELRRRLSDVRREVEDAARDINELEDYFKLDVGEDAFHGIRGKTFELQTNQYTYKLTPFKDVKQQHTRLGEWGSWLNPEHTQMEYTGGERCWNGPDRKTIVDLICSDTNKVLSVQEPNKCEYLMEFTTPAACSPERLAVLEQELARLENPGEVVIPPNTNDIF